jgi:Right handed beta helix region
VGISATARGLAALALALPLTAAFTPAAPRPIELYVAPKGNDSWQGTFGRPFATLARAQTAVRAKTAGMTSDIVVNLRGGTYTLSRPLTMSKADSGTHRHRVIYQAYARERVTLSGGREITGWRPDKAKIWQADVGDLDTRQLFADGNRVPRAALGRGLPGKVTRTKTGFVTTSTVPQSWRNPRDIEFVHTFATSYSEGRCGVAAIEGTAKKTTITMDQPCFRRADQIYTKIEDPPGLIDPTKIENSPSFLKPGSWYLDRSRPGHHVLSYRPRTNETPRHIVAPALTGLINGQATHDITLRGLTFAYTTWLGPDAPAGFPHIIGTWYYTGDDPAAEQAEAIPAAVAFGNATRITVENDHFTHLGEQALEFGDNSDALTVRANTFDDLSAGAVQLETPRNSHVDNNRVHNIGVEYHGSWAILLDQPHDSVVAHNRLDDLPYSGIVVLNSGGDATTASNTRIIGNRVSGTNNVLIDGGPIYLNGPQGPSFADGALVEGNVVRDSTNPVAAYPPLPPYAIYTDDGSDNVTIKNNVIYHNQRPLGGVAPARIRFTANFWDDTQAVWWGTSKQVVISGNTKLPARSPENACRANSVCRTILNTAGPQRT